MPAAAGLCPGGRPVGSASGPKDQRRHVIPSAHFFCSSLRPLLSRSASGRTAAFVNGSRFALVYRTGSLLPIHSTVRPGRWTTVSCMENVDG